MMRILGHLFYKWVDSEYKLEEIIISTNVRTPWNKLSYHSNLQIPAQ